MVNEILRTQPHYINGKKVDCKIAIPKNKLNNENSKKSKKKMKEKKNKNNSISINISSNKSQPLYFRKMFVGGLHPSLTTQNLISYFSQFGEIEKGIIMTDKLTGKSRGFGFIIFSNKETVDKIMTYSNCHFLYGKWVECKRAQPKIQNMKMLDENESFPKLNYHDNDYYITDNIINGNFIKENYEHNNIIVNENHSETLVNDKFKLNENLFLYQNYIPKEQIKFLIKNKENSKIQENEKIEGLIGECNNNNNNLLSENINEEKKEIKDSFKKEKGNTVINNKEEEKEKIINKDNKENNNHFQDFFNKKIVNPSSYNYFHYKLFDSNGEDITKLNPYNKNLGKIRLFPEEMDDSFEKNKKNNSISLKSNKTISSEEIEVSSELIEKNESNISNNENGFGPDRNKKEKSRSSGYSNDSYRPY